MPFDGLDAFNEAMEKVTGGDPTVDGFDFGPQIPKGVKRARDVIEGTSKTISNDMIAESQAMGEYKQAVTKKIVLGVIGRTLS